MRLRDVGGEEYLERLGAWTVGRALAWGVGAFVALAIVGGLLGRALTWFSTGADVVSAPNVVTQFRDAYSRYEALRTTAGNVCEARKVIVGATGDVRDQRITQEQAYEQNYRRISAEYNAAYDDAFRAKHVGPTDLPRPAPSLAEMLTQIGCRAPDPFAAATTSP